MLVASDEGTVFEVCKGRYSERPNFEVYLKGHSGDALRCDRVGRDSDIIDAPALSLAHAVQPDVLHMLGGETSMKSRGFLARFLYAVPRSPVGSRQIAPPPVHQRIARRYAEAVSAVWRLQGREDDYGKPAPYWLRFSEEADHVMAEFEAWLEPQLAEGEPLSFLGGWAGKLAGAAARIAGVLHLADTVGGRLPWQTPLAAATVARAAQIAREYLLPHALAAFGMMGRACSEAVEDAQVVLRWLERRPQTNEFSRRDLHQSLRNNRRFA
jgi:replicative DNA helicase